MKIWKVTVTEDLTHTFLIEAETEEDAREEFEMSSGLTPDKTECRDYGILEIEAVP
jgi:hypothetical protein